MDGIELSNLQSGRRALVAWAVEPIGRALSKTAVSPNLLTLIAFIISIISSLLVGRGWLVWGGMVLLLSGLFDLLDGAVARAKSQATKFGALLDSSLDRISEAFIFLAIIYLALSGRSPLLLVMLSGAGMASSFMISYVKARAEGLGIECSEGIFTRAERIILLSLGLIINQLVAALVILLTLSLVTIMQRLYKVWKSASGK